MMPKLLVRHSSQVPARAGVRLGIRHNLEQIALNPRYKRRLASEAEVLVLRPELKRTE